MSLNSTITIYKDAILTHDKNFALDKNGSELAIEEYLTTLESQTVSNFQYVKQGLAVTIKLNMSQLKLDFIDSNDWNYCKIQNDNNRAVYYFIMKKEWLSKETIAFSLVMDTLNSFSFNIDYLVNKKTTIQRQHKDRIKFLGSSEGTLITKKTFGIPTGDLSGSYTYSVGYTWEITFPPEAGVVEYVVKMGTYYPAPGVPTPDPTNALDSKLRQEVDIAHGVFRVIVVEPITFWGVTDVPPLRLVFGIYPVNEYFCRDVDLVSEGFNVPVYKEEIGQIEDSTNIETWYLLYRNRDNPNPDEQFNDSPVECYLIPSNPIKALDNSGSKLLNVNNTSNDKWYMFEDFYDSDKGKNIAFKIGDETYQPKEINKPKTNWEYAYTQRYFFVFHNVSGTSIEWSFMELYGTWYDNGSVRSQTLKTLKSGTLSSSDNIEVISPYDTILPYVSDSDPTTGYDLDEYHHPDEIDRINLATQTSVYLNDITAVDRTDSRNIKLIALPYCPAQVSNSVNGINILNNFQYDSTTGWYKSLDVTTPFKNNISVSLKESPLQIMLFKNLDINANYNRNDYYESKLLHSDFYRPKFVYDSFNYTYCLERYDYSNYLVDHPLFPDLSYSVTFVMTRTINSKFLFQLNTDYLVYSMDDYDGVVAVSRNNEEVLFNSAYINYVRSGFNYDKKSLARRQETAGWTIGLSVASAVLGVIGSVATQNPLPAVLGIAGAGVGITSQIVSNIQTQAQGEQTIQQKLEEANRQAVAVSGSDDVDLLTAYSNNKAKLVLYQISQRMKKLVGDLFYYCGYKLELQEVPDKDSRYWFNFVQCDLVVNYDSNVPSDIMNDLIERFAQGVTFFHYHNGFDLNQEKENLEISLVNR